MAINDTNIKCNQMHINIYKNMILELIMLYSVLYYFVLWAD